MRSRTSRFKALVPHLLVEIINLFLTVVKNLAIYCNP